MGRDLVKDDILGTCVLSQEIADGSFNGELKLEGHSGASQATMKVRVGDCVVQEAMEGIAHDIKEGLEHAKDSIGETATAVKYSVVDTAHDVAHRVDTVVDEVMESKEVYCK